MTLAADFLEACETHDPDGIRAALRAGLGPTTPIGGKRPIDCLIESYQRSPRLSDCVRVLFDAGATFGHPAVEAVLLDDADELRDLVTDREEYLGERVNVASAFTSCQGVTLLHVCAEFGQLYTARVLRDAGADIDAAADADTDGFGGQTPIFHAVNSIFNYCEPVMRMLVEAGADLGRQVNGLVWGPGAAWETLVLDVTPIAYAQCGLLPQFHREERHVYDNLAHLYRARRGADLPLRNVPNRYLARSRDAP